VTAFDFPGAPSPEILAGFDLNDYGNGQRLITLVGGLIEADGSVDVSRATLLYQLGLGWVGFNGRFWDRKLGEQLAKRAGHRVARRSAGCARSFWRAGCQSRT
jgi:putative DNA primase/helicase